MKKFCLLLLALMLAVSGLSVAAAEEEGITLRLGLWANAGELEGWNKSIQGIAEAVPGVKEIEIVHYPSTGDFWASIPSQMAAGTAPDLVIVTNENAYQYIADNMFFSFDPATLDLSAVADDAVRVWTIDDKLYGIPLSMQPTALVVNMDMWEAAGLTEDDYPTTWQKVEAAAEKLSVNGVYGLCVNLTNTFHFTQVVQGFGGGWGYGETIDSEANIKALDWLIDMFDKGWCISPDQLGDDWDGPSFAQGKVAMTTGGPWYDGYMADFDIHWKAFPIPYDEGNEANRSLSLHSSAVTVLSSCKNPELAAKAAIYLARPESLEIYSHSAGLIPANTNLAANYYSEHPNYANLEGAEAYSKAFEYPAETEQFQTTLNLKMQSVIYDSGNTMRAADIYKEVMEEYK